MEQSDFAARNIKVVAQNVEPTEDEIDMVREVELDRVPVYPDSKTYKVWVFITTRNDDFSVMGAYIYDPKCTVASFVADGLVGYYVDYVGHDRPIFKRQSDLVVPGGVAMQDAASGLTAHYYGTGPCGALALVFDPSGMAG